MNIPDINLIISMSGFALATSASPGPVNIVSAMSGARFGISKTIPYVLGATIGFVSILAITGFGFITSMKRFPHVEQALVLMGASYMLYVAYKLLRVSMVSIGKYKKSSPPSIFVGFVSQYINPKAWIVAISAISIYVFPGLNYSSILILFCLVFFIICLPSLLVWSVIGMFFSKNIHALRIFNSGMAFLLAISVVLSVVDFFRKI
jgi:threonine/homoserine/homoserine lactone efflux protein